MAKKTFVDAACEVAGNADSEREAFLKMAEEEFRRLGSRRLTAEWLWRLRRNPESGVPLEVIHARVK